MNEKDQKQLLELTPFTFGGSLIGRGRMLVHSIAGKWANLDLIAQQNRINQWLATRSQENAEWQHSQEKELLVLRKQVAELTQKVIQLEQTQKDQS